LLALCDAGRIVERPVRSLSLGERMKCELICALLHEPKVLFLDEPTIGLDLVAKDQVRSAIAELHAELNTTVVLASHDISDVASSCPSVSVLDRGRFLYRGTVAALLSTHARQHRVRLEVARPVGTLVDALAAHRFVQNGERHVTVELGVGAERLPEALSRLFAELPVLDVHIEAPSLEGVVRSLYGRAAEGGAPATEACSGREGALVEAE
jgi:ABC-2 type transport system ATP-binding protein